MNKVAMVKNGAERISQYRTSVKSGHEPNGYPTNGCTLTDQLILCRLVFRFRTEGNMI